jgi:hypothetical protein
MNYGYKWCGKVDLINLNPFSYNNNSYSAN